MVKIAAVYARVDTKTSMLMKLPMSWEVYIKVTMASLQATSSVLPSFFYIDPMLPLATTLTTFKVTLDSDSVTPKYKKPGF